jgi:two-component system response regulator DegU
MPTKNIALVSDFEINKEGIKTIISKQRGITIVADFQTPEELYAYPNLNDLDLVITDIVLPSKNGIELAENLINIVPVLGITYTDNFEFFYKAVRSGIAGYLLRNSPIDEFVKAIKTILKGDNYYSKKISSKLVTKLKEDVALPPLHKPKVKLTRREKAILTLAMKGMKSKEIGESLGISIRTVDKHRANIMQKCKVHNIVSLIQYVNKHKILL